jgi:hypothetical protein
LSGNRSFDSCDLRLDLLQYSAHFKPDIIQKLSTNAFSRARMVPS